MQINLFSQNWQKLATHSVAIGFGILICFLFFRSCHGTSTKPVIIKTPEIKGQFEAVKPEQKPITVILPQLKTTPFEQNLSKKESEFLQGQINQLLAENNSLQEQYSNASDSLKQALYNKSIQINSFTHTWENDTIKATATGLVRGEVQTIGLKYTIKPISMVLPPTKEVKFRLLAGGGLGINKELNQLIYKLNVGFQNSKGNIIRASIEQIGADKYYIGEYDFSIFSIKR